MTRSIIHLILACVSAGWVFAQQEADTTGPDPDAARELIRQWVKTERLLAEERISWEVEKKRMQSLLGIYRKELALLNEELEKAGGSAELIDKDKERLESELKQYRAAQQLMSETIARLLPRVKALAARFPQPLLDDVSSDMDVLNAAGALARPRDVLRSTIALLTTAERFNRSVTLAEETRTISDGKKITVDVLYLGLARAYYAARQGGEAGIGMPGKQGWEWETEGDIADDIRRAIAVYRKENQPQLIKLPVGVKVENGKGNE